MRSNKYLAMWDWLKSWTKIPSRMIKSSDLPADLKERLFPAKRDRSRVGLEDDRAFNPRSSKLPADLRRQLEMVEPSAAGNLRYFPCSVILKDGAVRDRVYVIEEFSYIKSWGVYPGDDPGKASIRVEDIASLTESPTRLPPKFANKLYRAGESGMGYAIFTVVFSDGSRQACATGNAVDWIDYPPGKSRDDVVKVLPHVGRDASPRPAAKYFWCLYSD